MKQHIIILCMSILSLVVIYISIQANKKETFVVKDFQSLKDELEQDSCDLLWSQDLLPANKATANNYLKSKRISKWKNIGGNNDTSCYMLDDIQDREMDPLLAVNKCENAFSGVPFISNVRVDNSRQTTTQVRTNACVFDINKEKISTSNLNYFWSDKIAAYDECIQANAYIIALYDELTIEKKKYMTDLSNAILKWQDLSNTKTQWINVINNIVDEISKSNVILQNMKDSNANLRTENFNFRNKLGILTNDYFTFSNNAVNFLYDFKNIDDNLQKTSDDYANRIVYYTQIKNDKFNELNAWIGSNNVLDLQLEDLRNNNDILTPIYQKNQTDITTWQTNLDTCLTAFDTKTQEYKYLENNFKVLNDSNTFIESAIKTCIKDSRLCASQLSNCSNTCSQLTTKINYFSDLYNTNIDLISLCGQSNIILTENIKNMTLYFNWVRSVYIHLSCDTFYDSVNSASNSYNNMLNACKAAEIKISNNIDSTTTLYNVGTSIAENDLISCTSNVDNIRNNINSNIYKDRVFIRNSLQMLCSQGEICPVHNKNDANEIGQDVCENIQDGYYTGKFLNYDGQRGGVYCSYWGDTKMFNSVKSNNATYRSNAGNVLPAGSYSNTNSNCYAKNYNLHCPNLKKPYNFKYCKNRISYVTTDNVNRMACRPDGYDYLVTHIAICESNEKCKIANIADKDELISYCKRYPLLYPNCNIDMYAY